MVSENNKGMMVGNAVLLGLVTLFMLEMLTFSMKAFQPVIMKYLVFYISLVVLGVLVLLSRSNRQRLGDLSAWYLPYLLYCGLLLLSNFYSDYPLLSIEPTFTMLALVIYFLSILSVEMTPKVMKGFLYMVYATSLLAGIYGFMQYLNLDPVPWMGFEGRVFSTFGHPNFYASFLIFSIPIVLLSIFSFSTPGPRIMGSIILVLSLSNLMFTRSRSAWLALLAAFIPFLFLRRTYNYIKKSRVHFLVFGLILVVIVLSVVQHREIGERLLSIMNPNDPGMKSRLVIYKSLLPGVLADPLFGKGIGTFSAVFPMFHTPKLYDIPPFTTMTMLHHAHSEYLEILLETGFVGLSLFFACLVVTVLLFKRLYHKESHADLAISLGIIIGLLAMLIQSLASVSLRFLSTQTIFWTGLAIIIGRSAVVKGPEPVLLKTPRQKSFVVLVFSLLLFTLAVAAVPYIVQAYKAEVSLMKAQQYNNKGKLKEAITYLNKSLKARPNSIDTLNTLGFTYIQLDRYSDALKVFNNVLQINPHYPLTHYYLGLVKFLQNDTAQAMGFLDEARKWRPSSWRIEELSGQIYLQEGKREAAKQHFQKAAEISRTETAAFYFLGEMAHSEQNYDQMFTSFSQALNANPNQMNIWQKVKESNKIVKRLARQHLEAEMAKDATPEKLIKVNVITHFYGQQIYDTITPALNPGTIVSQTFQANSDSIRSIQVRVATHLRTISATFRFRLFVMENHSQRLLHESVTPFESLADNQMVTFTFDEVPNARDKMFKAEFAVPSPLPGQNVHLWMKLQDNYSKGEVFINNLGIGSDLYFKIK